MEREQVAKLEFFAEVSILREMKTGWNTVVVKRLPTTLGGVQGPSGASTRRGSMTACVVRT